MSEYTVCDVCQCTNICIRIESTIIVLMIV